MSRLMKIIRVVTVPPIVVGVILCLLYQEEPSVFGRRVHFICSLICLVVFPLFAYVLQPLIPAYKDRGREGQRTLAMYFSVAGYFMGVLLSMVWEAPNTVWLIYMEYLLSGIVITIFNKCFHIKASGHACGATAPFLFAYYFRLPMYVVWIVVLLFVYIASIYTKRHTIVQLVLGSGIATILFILVEFWII